MTTLTVSANTDFSAQALNNIDVIDFTNLVNPATATFANTQFNNVAILNNVTIEGNFRINNIVVNGGNVNASQWQFVTWTDNADSITLNASSLGSDITGSVRKDTINGGTGADFITGGLGADILNGGASDDTFRYTALDQIVAGETISGGAGALDKIQIEASGVHDFSAATISGVERVTTTSGFFVGVIFDDSQLGAGKIQSFTGTGSNPMTLEIKSQSIDVDTLGLTFSGFSLTLVIRGDDLANTFNSSFATTYIGAGGADTLIGGNSADIFRYDAASELVAGETINGAGGSDTLRVQSGAFDFTGFGLTSIERLEFGATAAQVTLTASQANFITAVSDADTFGDTLTITGANASANMTFTNSGVLAVTLIGAAGNDTMNSPNRGATFIGGGGGDTMTGGAVSTYVYNAASELAAGETIAANTTNNSGDKLLLAAAGTYDFDTVGSAVGLDQVDFAAASGSTTLILEAGQIKQESFELNKIDEISGSAGVDHLVVNGGGGGSKLNFINFTDWTDGTDTITITGAGALTGTNFADTITGSSGNDSISGKAGVDTISAGDGEDDIFIAAGDLVAGEVIDGGANATNFGDVLELSGNGNFDFTSISITGIESLNLSSSVATISLLDSQVGTGKIRFFSELNSNMHIVISGAQIDLSAAQVNFQASAGTDDITLNGTAAADTIIGSNAGDIIFGGAGADDLIGGTGDDRFVYNSASDLVAGETIDGGAGTGDEIVFAAGNYNFGAGEAIGLEEAIFSDGVDASAALDGLLSRVTGGASATNAITMRVSGVVNAGAVVLDGGWTSTGPDADTLVLQGSSAVDEITGTAVNDTIIGGNGADILDGAGGNDVLEGGLGSDTYANVQAGDIIVETNSGASGSDTVLTALANYTLQANVERVNYTGAGNFVGTGTSINNRFQGGNGDDRFVDILGGADIFSGNGGTDTVDFRTSGTGAVINMATLTHGGAAAGDSYSGIDKFLGSNTAADTMTGGGTGRWVFAGGGGGDTLTGGVKNDQLLGQGGNDTLIGGADRDSLDGGTGNDTMTGGTAGDVFVFIDAAFGQDTITDYQDGIDSFKIFSAVADNLNDFIITNNGTTSVTLALTTSPTNTITINGAAPITIAADDLVFV